jgi:hemoglobin
MVFDPVGDVCAAVGERALRDLCAAFYRRVPTDDILGALYPRDDLAGAEERLADFLVMRFGGSRRYAEVRGHPRLRMRHAPFRVDARARERWLANMSEALAETGFPAAERERVQRFFEEVATFLLNA